MPTYDFKCPTCGEVVEIRVSSWHQATANDPAPPCPWCKDGTAMVKLASAPSFQIKGFSAANGYK